MSQPADPWYVRLPDGRVLRAASTHVLREHLAAGRIPADSRVRRSPEDEWVALEWSEEFADLAGRRPPGEEPPAVPAGRLTGGAVASRLDGARLRTVGLRGLADELLAALDSTLARPKLLVAAAPGLFGALVAVLAVGVASRLDTPARPWMLAGLGAALAAVAVVGNVLLTQMTYWELAYLRPASWAEARAGWLRHSVRLLIAYVVAVGATAGLLWLVRWGPAQLAPTIESSDRPALARAAGDALAVAALLVEVVLWAVLPFTFLLGPIVVVEECSAAAALRQWWWLVRRHLGRLFLYEAAALLGVAVTLSFAFPLVPAAWGRLGADAPGAGATAVALAILAGLAAAPTLAYLAVAHVFIYLNLRYEYDRAAP